MNFFDQCKQCSVRVDNGSGVLFQPMSEDYSYILTAKHNLYNDEEFESYNNPKNIEDIKFIYYEETEEKNILAKYEHESLDIAILKIEKFNFISSFKQFEEPKNSDVYTFYGYPNNRRNQEDKIQNFILKVHDINNKEIIAENETYYDRNDISGCSGGGVFKDLEGDFYLAGIECRMDGQGEDNNSRLRFIFIEAFDEIIEQNSTVLKPLYPPFLNNFTILLDNIFLLNGMEDVEKRLTQDRLRLIAEDLSKIIKPIDIKNKYTLLEKNYATKCYSNKELWSMYLEFMVISVFIDLCSPISVDGIEDINKKRKFLFLKSDNWKENKEEILTSDFSSLPKNATVVVACDGDRTPTSCHIKSSTLSDIGNGILPERFNTARGISPFTDFTFKHIHAIQKQMIDDCDNNDAVFHNATASKIGEIIKNEINKVFK